MCLRAATNSRVEDETGNRRERRVTTAFGRGKIRWKARREPGY